MYTNDRSKLRKVYIEAWRLHKAHEPKIQLEPMQKMLVDIIQQHPEYHALLEDEQNALDRDWLPEQGESNPFLHMSMHSAIIEQVSVDRPMGIRVAYQGLIMKLGDAHEAEHAIMECLAAMLWEAQSRGEMPNEVNYLACIRKLL